MENRRSEGKDAESEESAPTGSERILLVDDEEPVLRLETMMLERLGYSVCARTGSREALEVFTADPGAWDLVVTDMAMPGMTGVELTGKILAIRPGTPVILCTGFSERIGTEAARSMGVNGFLMKPILKLQLAREVRKTLDGAKFSR
jgi:CheY-like chemotaxis protein